MTELDTRIGDDLMGADPWLPPVPYSTSIEAAWSVVEKLSGKGWRVIIAVDSWGFCSCEIMDGHKLLAGVAGKKSAPEAICMAALAALEVK